jgi:hypothetical protein
MYRSVNLFRVSKYYVQYIAGILYQVCQYYAVHMYLPYIVNNLYMVRKCYAMLYIVDNM